MNGAHVTALRDANARRDEEEAERMSCIAA